MKNRSCEEAEFYSYTYVLKHGSPDRRVIPMITFRKEKRKEKSKIFEACVITSFIRSGEIIFHSCATVGLVPTVGHSCPQPTVQLPHPNRPNTQPVRQQCANSWSCRSNPDNLNRRVVLSGNRLPEQFDDKPARELLGSFLCVGSSFWTLWRYLNSSPREIQTFISKFD